MDPRTLPTGTVGLLHQEDGHPQRFAHFEVRHSPTLAKNESLDRKLHEARGGYRGELRGAGWDEYGKHPVVLPNAYRPERLPTNQDWVLVLQALSAP